MKKRVKLSNTNPYYSNEPAVSRALIADKPGIPSANWGGSTPKMVDKRPAKLSGLAGFTSKTKPKAGIHTHSPKLGSKDNKPPQQGKLKAGKKFKGS